ncbi:MAG: UvrD-helicase domain-containing protein [Candidatus Binataceae bacterium]|jgi:ATP-dependent exoDNAse (exonuclease V) beta subunit
MTLADQSARDRIANDLDTTLVIEAAAGTGKTTALVSRIVAAVGSGRATLDRIVAVTFTEKAAGELKLRLRSEIERARQSPDAPVERRERLQKSLEHLEQARIGTIHSFCADLIREKPVEAGVDPLFQVAAEDEAGALLGRAFDRWFEATLAEPGPGVRRILRRRESHRDGPRAILRRIARELCEWRDFDSPWRHEPFAREAEIDAVIAELRAVGELADSGDPDDWLTQALDGIRRFAREATRLETVRGRDYDALEAQILELLKGGFGKYWRWRGYGPSFGDLARNDVIERRGNLHERLKNFRAASGADLAPLIREELWPVVDSYQELKRRAGKLDFMDLLLIARDLIRDNAALRADLQRRFTHIFIDEFQDTDPLQAEILLLLSSDDPAESDWRRGRPIAGKLFIVGDPKQSIYRFRRADVSLYQRVKRQLIERGAALEHLTVSFRAVPPLQRMANAAFAPLMVESATQAAYEPLNPWRGGDESQPAIVALPVPAPYGDFGKIVDWRIDESLPDAIAAFVHWLIARSGWTVTERDQPDARRPIAARHIAILFRRFNAFYRDVTRPYVRALENRRVPHVLVKGSSFHEREEVEALRNALGAIERPGDELKVFAVLRGPLFGFSDGALLAFRESLGSLHPFRKLPPDLSPELGEVASALTVLRELHRGRNRRPIADTVSRLMAATRAHAGFAIWPTGEQALANIMRMMDQARRYEARGEGTSFRGFVDQLEADAQSGEAGEAPVVEEGTEGVRLMTVHSAKGLEFPIVILADITRNETAGEAQRFVDPVSRLCALRLAGCAPRELLDNNDDELRRDSEEAARLLYVAVTRARDLLIVPVLGDERREGWLGKLNDVLYPESSARRSPLSRQPPGCPPFGEDCVKVRPAKAPPKEKGVAPGAHRPATGDHQVVWWDPSILGLDVQETMGLRQSKLLAADESGVKSESGIRRYRDWCERRVSARAAAGAPTISVTTATEIAARAHELKLSIPEAEDVSIEEVAREPGRPHGTRFGTLVHEILLGVAFDSDRETITRVAAFRGRILGASDDEVRAAVEAVSRALGSPVMIRARDAATAQVRRECSVLVKIEDGTLVEGVADLAFIEPSRAVWTVVDFKTDLEISGRIDEYRAQLGIYLRGIRESTGQPARGVILWT